MKETVISILKEGSSSKQIKKHNNVKDFAMDSHETIYRWIWKDKRKNGFLVLKTIECSP